MGQDTLRETPVAKASDPKIKVGGGEWKAPEAPSTELAPMASREPPEGGARVDFGFGEGRVHTFEAKGPMALLLAIVVLLAVGAIFTLVFVFAVGAGAATAAGAAVAAALGVGAAKVGRLLGSRSRAASADRRQP
jgi:hypothetical protein